MTKLLSLYIIVLNKVKLVISCVKKGATVKKGKEELRPQRQRETNKKVPAGGKGFVAVEATFQLFSNALIDQKRAINEGPVGGRERGQNWPDEVFPVERIHSESIHPFYTHCMHTVYTLYAHTVCKHILANAKCAFRSSCAAAGRAIFLDILESGN